MENETKKKIEEIIKPFRAPADPLKQNYDDLKQPTPSQKKVAQNFVRKVDRRLRQQKNLKLGKPMPSRINLTIRDFGEIVNRKKVRSPNDTGPVPQLEGYNILSGIAEKITERKHGRKEVFRENIGFKDYLLKNRSSWRGSEASFQKCLQLAELEEKN